MCHTIKNVVILTYNFIIYYYVSKGVMYASTILRRRMVLDSYLTSSAREAFMIKDLAKEGFIDPAKMIGLSTLTLEHQRL